MFKLIGLVLLATVLVVAFEHWQWVVGIAGVLFVLMLAHSTASAAREEERKRLDKAARLNDMLPKYLNYVTDGKTERTRLNNVDQVISNLRQIMELDPEGKVVPDAEELMRTMNACRRTIPAEMALAKVEKALFKKQKKAAMNAYLDALFSVRKLGTTDADFLQARVVAHDTGRPITVADIAASAKELGWDGETAI
jgi:hypothetical protein